MIALARWPTSLPACTAARSMSPGRKLDQPATRGELLGLRSLARPRRPQQDQVHIRLVAPLSFAFLMRPSYWCASRWLWICATVSIVTLTAISSDVPPK